MVLQADLHQHCHLLLCLCKYSQCVPLIVLVLGPDVITDVLSAAYSVSVYSTKTTIIITTMIMMMMLK